jgi:hypothetical protein
LDKSLALTHDNLQVRSDRALALLALGKIQEGLAEYEVRWDLLAKSRIWDLNIREWRGEALNGCRILVHHEQGFGDGIMLARFLTPLAKLGCSITLAVPNELLQLFSRSFRFIHVIDMEDATLGDTSNFDYHVPMLSLMRWLKVKTPAEIDAATYLYGRPIEGLRLPQGYRIGVCWASGNHGAALIDRRRIVPITSFLPLTEIPGVSLVALQKSDESADIVRNGMEGLIFDVSHRLEDFAVAADIISQLDLVISVDSAIAHLAGAMGKPCFMLSPFTRCWRWWNKTSGWPWYNRMTLFHQVESGSWNLAMRRIVEDVKKGRVK